MYKKWIVYGTFSLNKILSTHARILSTYYDNEKIWLYMPYPALSTYPHRLLSLLYLIIKDIYESSIVQG